ncbi:MAG: hypothetical protein [Anelloviridae sp.]|nr:MAG: hypothetical protein [Anelloviridae sp.]
MSGCHCFSTIVCLCLRLRPLLRLPRLYLRLYRRRGLLLTYRLLPRRRKVLLDLLLRTAQPRRLQGRQGRLLYLHQAVVAAQGVPVGQGSRKNL